MSAYYETITVPADQIQLVFGQFDRNIKNLEKAILKYDKIAKTLTTEIDNNNLKFNEKLEEIVDGMFK